MAHSRPGFMANSAALLLPLLAYNYSNHALSLFRQQRSRNKAGVPLHFLKMSSMLKSSVVAILCYSSTRPHSFNQHLWAPRHRVNLMHPICMMRLVLSINLMHLWYPIPYASSSDTCLRGCAVSSVHCTLAYVWLFPLWGGAGWLWGGWWASGRGPPSSPVLEPNQAKVRAAHCRLLLLLLLQMRIITSWLCSTLRSSNGTCTCRRLWSLLLQRLAPHLRITPTNVPEQLCSGKGRRLNRSTVTRSCPIKRNQAGENTAALRHFYHGWCYCLMDGWVGSRSSTRIGNLEIPSTALSADNWLSVSLHKT